MTSLVHLGQTLASTYQYSYPSTSSSGGSTPAGFGILFGVFALLMLLIIVAEWRIFQKAGRHGWASIIPVYNNWVLFEIVGYPGWWAILSLVPIASIFTSIMVMVSLFKLAKMFGKGTGFAVCTILFSWVCLPILAFGSAKFNSGNDSSGQQSNDPPYPQADLGQTYNPSQQTQAVASNLPQEEAYNLVHPTQPSQGAPTTAETPASTESNGSPVSAEPEEARPEQSGDSVSQPPQ